MTKQSSRLRARPFLFVLACASTAIAHAAAPAPLYLSAEEKTALVDSVSPPPKLDSDEDKADLAAVLKAQESRTPEQIAEIKSDAEFTIALFKDASGLDEKNFPLTWALLDKANRDVTDVYRQAKDKFQRPRPFRGHPDVIKNIVDANGFGYPSGHSTRANALAAILSELLPEKKDALVARATQIAQSRVNGGEHYPSDIAAGTTLGAAIVKVLCSKKSFLDDLENVKIELKKAPKAP